MSARVYASRHTRLARLAPQKTNARTQIYARIARLGSRGGVDARAQIRPRLARLAHEKKKRES